MAKRHVFGRYHAVEPGVRALPLKVSGSKSKLAALYIDEGVEHLFVAAVCGPKIGSVRTDWVIGVLATDGAESRSGGLIEVVDLPAVVRERYRLDGYGLVSVIVVAVGYNRGGEPSAVW